MKRVICTVLCFLLTAGMCVLSSCQTTDTDSVTESGTVSAAESGTVSSADTEAAPKPKLKRYEDVVETADRIYFSAVTDAPAISYHTGDEIVFQVSLMADGEKISCPKLGWLVFTDDGNKYKGEVSGEEGGFEVRIPATGTGFIRMKCFARDEEDDLLPGVEQDTSINAACMFGAGVNVDEIGTAWEEPADFDAFWAEQLALIDSCELRILSVTELPTVTAGYTTLRMQIAGPDGCGTAGAYISYPPDRLSESLPMAAQFSGYGASDPFYEAPPVPLNGTITLTIFAHGLELGNPPTFYGSLNSYGFSGNDSMETCYFRKMLLRDLLMLRFAKAYFGTGTVIGPDGETLSGLDLWDGTLTTSGGSQGAFQALAMTALDHDVTNGSYSVPWMCDIAGRMSGGKSMDSVFRPTYTDVLAYFDLVSFARRIPASVTVEVYAGLGDYVCPPSGVFAMYNQLRCTATMTAAQGRTHGYIPPKAQTAMISKKPAK